MQKTTKKIFYSYKKIKIPLVDYKYVFPKFQFHRHTDIC